MLVEAVVSVNLNFSDFVPSGRDALFNNLRSNFVSNVFSSVALWYESTLITVSCSLERYEDAVTKSIRINPKMLQSDLPLIQTTQEECDGAFAEGSFVMSNG